MPVKYRYKGAGEPQMVDGRRLVARYNCTGCHIIENAGGNIRRLFEEQPTLAPPILNGEGEKVQSDVALQLRQGARADPAVASGTHAHARTERREAGQDRRPISARSTQEIRRPPRAGALTQSNVPNRRRKLMMSKDYFDCSRATSAAPTSHGRIGTGALTKLKSHSDCTFSPSPLRIGGASVGCSSKRRRMLPPAFSMMWHPVQL